MQITFTALLAAALLAGEAFARVGTHGGDGKDLTARVRRHHNRRHGKRSSTCKAKSSTTSSTAAVVTANVKVSTSSSSAGNSSSSSSTNSTGMPSGQTTKLGLSWTYGNAMNIAEYTNLGASW